MTKMSKIGLFILSLFLFGCGKQYKYKIFGNVMVNDSLRDAIWYTDTITIKNDTAYYFNSDGNKVTIAGEYNIYEINKK